MPRDGSGIYSQPFPAVVEGTTIESAVYNGYTADITIDLNTPRPISSGGTGANNAADAMAALGGEGSKIEVTNYDSHAFTAGSFYSKASASNPPVAGHAFAGICYVAVVSGVATSDMFIEVRDRDEATQPGSLFVRQKKNGTWSGWLKAVGTTTGATPPTAPTDGMLWWDPTQGKLFIWYSDPNTAQWVEAVATPDLGPDDFVSVDVAQNFTEAEKKTARSNIYAAPFDALAYNGMQINGSMEVSQEWGLDNAKPITALVAGYMVDGWAVSCEGAVYAANAFQTVTSFPPGFSKSLIVMVTTGSGAPPSGTWFELHTPIEGYRILRLAWGTANAQPITLGFWVKASRAGLHSGVIRNGAAPYRSYPFTYTINAANTWEYNTATIPGDTAGTWNTTNGTGATIFFNIASGSSQLGPPGVWAATNYLGATGSVNNAQNNTDYFQVTGVVVLPGIEAPSAARSPLIMRPYDQELATCQRYFYKGRGQSLKGLVLTGVGPIVSMSLPVPLRAQPTLGIVGVIPLITGDGQGGDLASVQANYSSADEIAFVCNIAAGGTFVTAGKTVNVNLGSNAGFITADARL